MTIPGEVGAIQRGPDGQIYVAVNGSAFLGVIQPAADTLTISTFNANGLALAGGTNSLLGLPNFIQIIADPVQGPGISITGICEDDSVNFSGIPTDQIDEFFWRIKVAGVGGTVLTTSSEQTFNFFFPDPGLYEAELRLTNRCGLDTLLTQAFQIFAKPPLPTFLPPGVQPVICTGSLTLEAHPVDDPTLTYVWGPTAETTRTIVVDEFGQYSVTKTNAQGCSISDDITVADNRPIVDLGPDVTICQNVVLADLDAGAVPAPAGTTYQWTIDGAPANNTAVQPVDTSTPPFFDLPVVYEVTVTTPGGPGIGCTAVEDKAFIFKEAPVFNATHVDPTTCATPPFDGSISVTITAPAASLFSYFIVGPSIATGTDQAAGIPFGATGLQAGIYGITVSDQVSGCATSQTESLSDNTFTATTAQVGNCSPIGIQVTHNAAGTLHI